MRIQLLSKLLELTRSNNDHEALSAIRKANSLINENHLTWTQILAPLEFSDDGEDLLIEDMFLVIFESDYKSNDLTFVLDLFDFYRNRGYLSDKQTKALERIYKKAKSFSSKKAQSFYKDI